MEQRLKQRLVGATVLVIFIVIVVPELFDEDVEFEPPVTADVQTVPGEPGPDFTSRIVPLDETDAAMPVADEVVTVTLADDEPPLVATEPLEPAAMAEPVIAVQTTPAVPRPKPKPASTPAGPKAGLSSWVVQLASFSDSTRAVTLRDDLVGQGFAAFIQSVANESGTFSRVFVGPELDKDRADQLREQLLTETRLSGQVVRFP